MESRVPLNLYLDTSIVIGAIFTDTPHASACRIYCERLAAARTYVYFSQALRLDFARAIRRLATNPGEFPVRSREEFRLDQWGTNPMVRHRWLTAGLRQFNVFFSQFGGVTEIPLTTEQWQQSLEIMAFEALDATDAMHLAAARSISVEGFATVDRDFRRIIHPRIHLIRDAGSP